MTRKTAAPAAGAVPGLPDAADYLEGLMEGFVAYDGDWVMTYINAAGERILGRQRADVLGKTWHQAFPHAVGNPVDLMYQRVMRTRTPERMEYYYPHYRLWMEISASPVKSGGVGVYFRDITDRETLREIGRTLAADLDLERVVQAVTDAATEASGAKFGAFFYNVKNESGESYTLYTISGVPREEFAKFPMPRNTAIFAPTFNGTGIVRSDDITRDPRYGKNAPHQGMPKGHLPVRSYLAVPVISRSGEVIGGLFFGHEQTGVFTERAERLVGGIASQAAIAMDNARLYRAEQEAAVKLREADRRKDEFLATLAHELRNPLAPIRTGLHLLRIAQPGSENAEQARAMMERQLTHLIRLVDDLLEVSRISRGKIDLRRAPLELATVVLSAVETTRPAIEAGRHKLDISLPARPLTVDADFVRLAQVLANLLNNAAKYTDPGGEISLAVRGEGGEAVISVRDNGVGIPAELLPRVFDMFAQVDRTLERAQGGLGIGLALAKSLVEMHGGTIQVESEGPGKGSEFIVRLPASASAERPGAGDTPFRFVQARTRRRVLVVDDNVDAAQTLGLLLGEMGCEVQIAHGGAAAIEAARSGRPPQIVLLDISMPGVDGYKVVRQLRQDLAFRDVPFIAVTGLGREADRERAREAGFNEHLVKPVAPEALREILERF
jgi:PAS domain S-box-containing protein